MIAATRVLLLGTHMLTPTVLIRTMPRQVVVKIHILCA